MERNYWIFVNLENLRIANGRLLGDHLGYYTCYNHVGMPSVFDYLLIDLNFICLSSSATVNLLRYISYD